MTKFKVQHLFLIPVLALCVTACAKRNKAMKKATGAQAQTQQPQPSQESTEGADGSLAHAPNCINPIAMEPMGDEVAIQLADFFKDSNKGTYSLVSTEYFSETEAKEQIHSRGSEFKTPENLSSAITDEQKTTIVCHNTKKGKDSEIRGNLDLPNSFNAADGKGAVIRQDRVAAKNGLINTVSTLYNGTTDLKHMLSDGKPEDMKVLIVKDSEGQVTIRMQFSSQDLKTGKKITETMAGTYALSDETSKEEPKVENAEIVKNKDEVSKEDNKIAPKLENKDEPKK